MLSAFPKDLSKAVVDSWSEIITGDYIPPECPNLHILTQILEVSYFAATSAEEGRYPQFNILVTSLGADIEKDSEVSFWSFSEPRPLNVEEIRRLAPASDMKKSAIWVEYNNNTATIKGLVDLGASWYRAKLGLAYKYYVPKSLMLQLDRPGRMKVYQGQFHVATLADGELLTADLGNMDLFLHEPINQGMEILARSFTQPQHEHPRDSEGFWFIAHWNVYASIVNSISQSGHGGMLIISMPNADEIMPYLRVKYGGQSNVLRDAFIEFINARNDTADHVELHEFKGVPFTAEAYKCELNLTFFNDSLVEATRFVAQLAGCDGSIVITSDLTMLGFGAEIRAEMDKDVSVLEVQHEMKQEYRECDLEQFGMRHRSAIKLASKTPSCRILTVSQDGPISAVWSEGKRVFVKKGVSMTNKNMTLA